VTGGYWPFWAGALALASVGMIHYLLTGRTLGVSSSYQKVVQARAEAEAARAEALVGANAAAFEAALLAATAAQFGNAAQAAAPVVETKTSTALPSRRVPWTANALFLVMLAVGGLLAHLLRGGTLTPQLTMGPTFESLFGAGAKGWAVLLFGGVLVGFGTRMAGGCTSGHGLSGVSRFQKGSLLATAAFFGTGVVASFVFAWVLR
jgi:uncharacterized membrane protein YedE/YeeE